MFPAGESYNSTKHNPPVNLTSPGRARRAKRKMQRARITSESKGEGRKKGRRTLLLIGRRWDAFSRCATRMHRQRGERPRERKKEAGRSERSKVRGQRGKRFGASPIILQSSVTTRRRFCRAASSKRCSNCSNDGLKRKAVPDRYLSFSWTRVPFLVAHPRCTMLLRFLICWL